MDRGLPVTAPAAPSGAAVAAGARCGWRTGCGGLAVAFVAVAAAAGAQTFAASDPAMVKTLLEEFGYPTEIEYDPGGQAYIGSATAGLNFEIDFYGCEGGRDCKLMAFLASFTLDSVPRSSLADDWNREHIFGRAFGGETPDRIYLDHVVLTEGGMTRDNFAYVLSSWNNVIVDFAHAIGFR